MIVVVSSILGCFFFRLSLCFPLFFRPHSGILFFERNVQEREIAAWFHKMYWPAIEEEHAAKVVSGETSSYFHRLPPSPGGEASESALRPEPMWKVPVAFTPLIGREQEVASVCVLLKRPAIRLLTLVGAGALGKTQLSRQVATEIREYFSGGG